MIDKRLEEAASLVRKDSYVCDIGTDHANLPIYLVRQNITKNIIACDINIKPLGFARLNIKKNGLESVIKTVISDGLSNIDMDIVEDIIICGIGGELIAKIILDSPFTRNKSKRFILSPMTNQRYLRDTLYKNGFSILLENPVISKGHYYTVMYVAFTGDIVIVDDIFAEVGMIPQSDSQCQKDYLQFLYNKAFKIYEGLLVSNSSTEKINKQKQLVSKLNELIKI